MKKTILSTIAASAVVLSSAASALTFPSTGVTQITHTGGTSVDSTVTVSPVCVADTSGSGDMSTPVNAGTWQYADANLRAVVNAFGYAKTRATVAVTNEGVAHGGNATSFAQITVSSGTGSSTDNSAAINNMVVDHTMTQSVGAVEVDFVGQTATNGFKSVGDITATLTVTCIN